MRIIPSMTTACVSIALLAAAAAPGMASAQDYYTRGQHDTAYQAGNAYDGSYRQAGGYRHNRGDDQGYGYQSRSQWRESGYRGYARGENYAYGQYAGYRGDRDDRHADWGYRHHRWHEYRNWGDRTGW